MGGIKNVDLINKITSMITSFHDRKIILLLLIGKHIGKNFKFHYNVDISNEILSNFPSFYQDIFIKWIKNFTS